MGKILGFPTAWVVIGLMVVGYMYVPAFSGIVNDLWGNLTGLTPGSTVISGGVYTGNINFVESIQDTLTGATVDPTADAYYWFAEMPTSLSGAVALTAAVAT